MGQTQIFQTHTLVTTLLLWLQKGNSCNWKVQCCNLAKWVSRRNLLNIKSLLPLVARWIFQWFGWEISFVTSGKCSPKNVSCGVVPPSWLDWVIFSKKVVHVKRKRPAKKCFMMWRENWKCAKCVLLLPILSSVAQRILQWWLAWATVDLRWLFL